MQCLKYKSKSSFWKNLLISFSGQKNEHKKFLVCVLKDEVFAKALKNIYKDERFKTLSVELISIKDETNIPHCQLLFLGKKTQDINKVLLSLKGQSVLTVSDNHMNIPKNVMIVMFVQNNKIKYIINNKLAQDSKVHISHLLLRSAQEVIK
ncbi:YfiR family protein [Sulfurimonas sp. MAG313]|nr:YfiR family protein [Sulfurimonas sp. MAG313]MDF1881342.1 YfiR family protein [Sulfurimonas sp. MAG313]